MPRIIKLFTHAMLVTRGQGCVTPSAAARFSLLAAEFKECSSVILATNGLGKDTERYVLLLGTAIVINGSRSL